MKRDMLLSREGRFWRVAFLACALCFGVAANASAGQTGAVIEAGREKDILALFRPYELGGSVEGGYRLWSVQIQSNQITVGIREPASGREAAFLLKHPLASPSEERSKSFAIETPAVYSSQAEAALQLLRLRVIANDRGDIWRESLISKGLGPPIDWALGSTMFARARQWATDGIVIILMLTALLLSMTCRAARSAPRWVVPTLSLVVLVGAALRWWMAPYNVLGAWPFSRLFDMPRAVYEGVALARLSAMSPEPFYLTDVIHLTTFAFAVLTPLAMFVHTRYLIDDARWAVLAAALLAVLPMHIRFSLSEVAFVPSLVISSICLALAHLALRDGSAGWRLSAMLMLPILVWWLVRLRPLNGLFVGVLLGVGVLAFRSVPKARLAFVMGLALVSGAVSAGLELFHRHGDAVADGLSVQTVLSGLWVLVNPARNALTNARITPPVFLIVAVWGGVALWRAQRPFCVFLLGWLLSFLIAHGVVVPLRVEMQARYHLHLIVPFVILIVKGVEALVVSKRWRRFAIPALGAYAALCPWLHRGFIRDVQFNLQREYEFVSHVREQIPEGCTILEYTGATDGSDKEARFLRLGARLKAGGPDQRFTVQVVDSGADPRHPGADPLSPDAQEKLRMPPECLVIYSGLSCSGLKPLEAARAPACEALEASHPLEVIAKTRFLSRFYDSSVSPGLRDGQSVELALYRVRPRVQER